MAIESNAYNFYCKNCCSEQSDGVTTRSLNLNRLKLGIIDKWQVEPVCELHQTHLHCPKINIAPTKPSRKKTIKMRSCHPRGIGHRRRWTIVVSRWENHILKSACCLHPSQASSESPKLGPYAVKALVVQDSMEHFHSWLLFLPTKMPFVDLSLLLSPHIPPLFQNADISPIWVQQELDLVGPFAGLFVSITPSKLFTALVISFATEARSAGYQGAQPSFDSQWQ